MKNFSRVLLLLIIVLAASCKSAKKIQTALTKTKADTTQMILVDNAHADSVAVIRD